MTMSNPTTPEHRMVYIDKITGNAISAEVAILVAVPADDHREDHDVSKAQALATTAEEHRDNVYTQIRGLYPLVIVWEESDAIPYGLDPKDIDWHAVAHSSIKGGFKALHKQDRLTK